MTDIRALALAATPGPWRMSKGRYGLAALGRAMPGTLWFAIGHIHAESSADAAYIAALDPQTVLALLDERDALRAALLEEGHRQVARESMRRRAERRARSARDAVRCATCGFARINVIHETDREHAIGGLDYYADVPFCAFASTHPDIVTTARDGDAS